MKINWKARFKNKTFLIVLIPLVITFIYKALDLFGVIPSILENDITDIALMLVDILTFVGVVIDPTTNGLGDSKRALTYYTENDEREVEE